MSRDVYKKYSTRLDHLFYEISKGLHMYPDVCEYLKQPEVRSNGRYGEMALKYAIENHDIELLDVLKFNYDSDYYKSLSVGTKAIQALYDFMQDTYGLSVSQYTAEDLNKLLKLYMQESKIKDTIYQQTFHVSFDTTLKVQAKDKETALALLKERLEDSITWHGGEKSNIEIIVL